jgi:hypothetical protein
MYSLNNFNSAFLGAFLIIIVIAIAISVLIAVFYLLNLQNLLKEIEPKNRLVEPTNVWLMFIPLFNIVYPFILYPKICDSVKNEYSSRGIKEAGDFGRGIGIAMPILSLCGIIPILGSLAGLANFILFIVFWVKMAGYKTKLKSSPKGEFGMSSNTEILD